MQSPTETILQRVRSSGVRAASIVDLIAIAFSRREADVQLAEDNSRQMLQRFGNLRGLYEAGASDLAAVTGIDGFELLRCQALMELGRRTGAAGKGPIDAIDGPEDVMILLDDLRHEKKEYFIAILMDAKNNVLRRAVIHVGTLSASMVGAREVFREAVRDGASAMIVAHNHPSGDPTPSPEDIDVTQRLVEVGNLLDIPVLDHVIIGERRFVSLAREGYIGP